MSTERLSRAENIYAAAQTPRAIVGVKRYTHTHTLGVLRLLSLSQRFYSCTKGDKLDALGVLNFVHAVIFEY